MFSILGARVEGAAVLDLFAGSGAIGLEALSRGAASCVFVDEHRGVERVILENLEKARLEGGRVARADAHVWLRREMGRYDLIFADPPYARSALDRNHLREMFAKNELVGRLTPGGLLILESPAEADAETGEGWELLDRRTYGGSAILLYARSDHS